MAPFNSPISKLTTFIATFQWNVLFVWTFAKNVSDASEVRSWQNIHVATRPVLERVERRVCLFDISYRLWYLKSWEFNGGSANCNNSHGDCCFQREYLFVMNIIVSTTRLGERLILTYLQACVDRLFRPTTLMMRRAWIKPVEKEYLNILHDSNRKRDWPAEIINQTYSETWEPRECIIILRRTLLSPELFACLAIQRCQGRKTILHIKLWNIQVLWRPSLLYWNYMEYSYKNRFVREWGWLMKCSAYQAILIGDITTLSSSPPHIMTSGNQTGRDCHCKHNRCFDLHDWHWYGHTDKKSPAL